MDDTLGAIWEYGQNSMHIVWSILVIILIPIFYACGLSITKYGSAAQRTTIETSRNIVIWIFFLAIPIKAVQETFAWL